MSQRIEGPTRTFTAGGALEPHRRVRLSSGKLAYAGASDLDGLGVLQNECFADGDLGTVRLDTAEGTENYVASEAISLGATGYAAASGKIAATGTVPVCEALEAATADLDVIEGLGNRGNPTAVARASLTQDDLKPYAIPLTRGRVWDAPQTNAVGTPANDDLGLIYNTFGTASPSLESGDSKAASTTRKVGFQIEVPAEYVAGETINLVINAGMKTTVSDTTATLDCEVTRQAAPTVDICATAAQSINSLTAADKTFVLTPTGIVPGELLDVVLTVAIVDGATGTAVIGKLYRVTLQADIKG